MSKKHTVALMPLLCCLLLASPFMAGASAMVADDQSGKVEQVQCPLAVRSSPVIEEAVQQLAAADGRLSSWGDAGQLEKLVQEIEGLAWDGLNPDHYQLAVLKQAHARLLSGGSLTPCEAEDISRAFVRALNDLHYGRINPAQQQLIWYAEELHRPATAGKLQDLAELGFRQGMQVAFDAARPAWPAYRQLRKAYKAAQPSKSVVWTAVPTGLKLRLGDVDSGVSAIKQRLREEGYLPELPPDQGEDEVYSAELERAVREFQRRHELQVDGVVGRHTTAELNITPAYRLKQIRANLERLRWFDRDREDSMLLVDIAGAEVRYFQGGESRFVSRAQAGQPKRKTPILKSHITHVTVNPTWIVPPTILRNDVLPEVRKDIGYLSKKHIRVYDKEGKELNPRHVNWSNPGWIRLRQDAGPEAALGKVAIRFTNPYAVYLHDTPHQKLFATSSRFYSSGCVRVENALSLAELLFENAPAEDVALFNQVLASGKTKNIAVPSRIAVLLVYWTAMVDEEGVIQFRPDIYEWDSRLIELLERAG